MELSSPLLIKSQCKRSLDLYHWKTLQSKSCYSLLPFFFQYFWFRVRVQIIALRFSNCEVSSSYYDWKMLSSFFFTKENLVHPQYVFLHYIHKSFIYCLLLSKEIVLIPKIAQQNAKNASHFLKANFRLRWTTRLP